MSGGQLTTITRIAEALRARPAQLTQLRAEGTRIAGYFCCNVPEELVLAAGLVPVRLGTGGDERLVEVGGRYISHQNCPFVRQSVGVFAVAGDPRGNHLAPAADATAGRATAGRATAGRATAGRATAGRATAGRAAEPGAAEYGAASDQTWVANTDVVLAAATCPQIYRMAEVIEHFFGRQVEILGVPRNFASVEGREYFRGEVADFAQRLEKLGTEITAPALADAVALLAEIRTSIQRLYQLQAAYGTILSWREVINVVQAGFALDRREYARLLRELIDEVGAVAAAEPPPADERIRLFLSGSIIPPGDTKIIDLVDELGGRIVGDDLCTGLRPSRDLVVAEATTEAIADAYLDRVPCAALPHLSLEGDRRLANTSAAYTESRAEGLLYHSLRYCDPYTFKANETKQVLGRDVPFIEIHTEYATSDTEGIRTRVDAFLEMIESQRGIATVAPGAEERSA